MRLVEVSRSVINQAVLIGSPSEMDFLLKLGLRTIAINVFFKKSFHLRTHCKVIFTALLLSFLQDFLSNQVTWILIGAFIWIIRLMIRNGDSQDATNFVLVYFTLLVLSSLEFPQDLPKVWSAIPYLALFQIIRKPDSLKKCVRKLRVALAPVSFILTMFASVSQLYYYSQDLQS